MTDAQKDDLAHDLLLQAEPGGGLSFQQYQQLMQRLRQLADQLNVTLTIVEPRKMSEKYKEIELTLREGRLELQEFKFHSQAESQHSNSGYYLGLIQYAHRLLTRAAELDAAARQALSTAAAPIGSEFPSPETDAAPPALKRSPRASKSKRADTPADPRALATTPEASERPRRAIKDVFE